MVGAELAGPGRDRHDAVVHDLEHLAPVEVDEPDDTLDRARVRVARPGRPGSTQAHGRDADRDTRGRPRPRRGSGRRRPASGRRSRAAPARPRSPDPPASAARSPRTPQAPSPAARHRAPAAPRRCRPPDRPRLRTRPPPPARAQRSRPYVPDPQQATPQAPASPARAASPSRNGSGSTGRRRRSRPHAAPPPASTDQADEPPRQRPPSPLDPNHPGSPLHPGRPRPGPAQSPPDPQRRHRAPTATPSPTSQERVFSSSGLSFVDRCQPGVGDVDDPPPVSRASSRARGRLGRAQRVPAEDAPLRAGIGEKFNAVGLKQRAAGRERARMVGEPRGRLRRSR